MTGPSMFGALRVDRNQKPSKLLHHWRALDGSLTPLTGEAATYTRASVAWAVDDNGNLYDKGYNQSRFEPRVMPSGLREIGLLVEPARGNVCLQNNNFGTTWATVGSPTRVAAAKTAGKIVMDLIGDDDSGATEEGYTQVCTFTTSTIKSVGLALAPGTVQGASGSLLRLRDLGGSVNRLAATVTWVNGAPSVSMATGTYLGAQPLANGAWFLRFRTTAVVHTNTNRLELYPASGIGGGGGGGFSANTRRSTDVVMRQPAGSIGASSASDRRQAAGVYRGPVGGGGGGGGGTGNLYAGGVLVEENIGAPGSPIPTTTAAVTTALDDLSFSWGAAPKACTVYARFTEQGALLRSDSILSLGDGAAPYLTVQSNGAFYGVAHHNGSILVISYLNSGASPVYGDHVEIRAVLRADGSIYIGRSINGGAEVVSTPSVANALAAAWGASRLAVGQAGAAIGQALWYETKVAAGEVSMDKIRTLY